MKVTPAEHFRNNTERLTPATRRKGVITQVNGESGRSVDLYFIDNPQTIVRNVQVSIPTAQILAQISGSGGFLKCIVDVFDESNSRDMVVAYVY